ncbi:MAG: DoxX family protein [Cytophagales bacterium]
MYAVVACILLSSLSFLAYAFFYFNAPHMKNEFKRFGLEKMGLTIVILEIAGALGLLLGLKFYLILTISSLGLALLMFAGLVVRIRLKDSVWISLPAFFYMVLNAFIFWTSIYLQT